MSRTDWPQECPLNDNGCMPTGDEQGTTGLPFDELLAEHRYRWRIEPAAVRLSNALDAYLKADHNGDVPKVEAAYIKLLDAQRAFERAAR